MSITPHIDAAKDRIGSTQPEWTGPHPDLSAFIIGQMIEAVGRDLVQAIADLSTDVTRAIKEVADSID